nr:unnamed protein product [Digitaria exilis]
MELADIASKIIDLKNRAQEVGERRTRYGVQDPKDDSRSIPGSKQSRPTHSYAADHLKPLAPQLIGTMEPVGLEDAIAEQGRWLTGSEGITKAEPRVTAEKHSQASHATAGSRVQRRQWYSTDGHADGIEGWSEKQLKEKLKAQLE